MTSHLFDEVPFQTQKEHPHIFPCQEAFYRAMAGPIGAEAGVYLGQQMIWRSLGMEKYANKCRR